MPGPGNVRPNIRLRVAIQKSGRLSDRSLDLLRAAGLRIRINGSGLYFRASELPIDILLVRDDDITGFVNDGVCDMGIVGQNVFEEYSCRRGPSEVDVRETLGFSRCRLAIAVPKLENYTGPQDLAGHRIATSYRGLLQRFLDDNNVKASVVEMSGAVELAPKLGIADTICDIVSSGATLEANGLKAVETVLDSEALLIENRAAMCPEKREIAGRLLQRIRGVLASDETKYIMLNAPAKSLDRITELLPGADAPTLIPLNGDRSLFAVHAVCRESVFWETMEGLKAAGASSILVLPIEKMMV